MNVQFKKGVLELIVLVAVNNKDMYGYELVAEVSKVVNVNEGTIYPLFEGVKRRTAEEVLSFNGFGYYIYGQPEERVGQSPGKRK